MPRLNVEDEFWSDVRVEALRDRIGKFQAFGVCLAMWKHAQKFWNGSCKPIPKAEWDLAGYPKEIFEVGLAKEVEDGVYVCGSQKHFEWYKAISSSASERGKLGGRVSAQRQRDGKGRLLSSKDQAPSKQLLGHIQADSKQLLGEIQAESKPSSSSSSSFSRKNIVRLAPNPDHRSIAERTLASLNSIAGRFLHNTEENRAPIIALLKSEIAPTEEDLVSVIRVKSAQWKDDPKWKKYLRPETLFQKKKFDGYLSEAKDAQAQDAGLKELFGV